MAREKFPSDEVGRQMLRFPSGLKERIAEAAKANNRSINAEIVSRVELTFQLEAQAGDPTYIRRSRKDMSDLEKIRSEYELLGSHLDALGRRIKLLEADLVPYHAAQKLKSESEAE